MPERGDHLPRERDDRPSTVVFLTGRDHPGEVRYDRHGDASTPANHGREESRSAVLFVAAPLRIEGGTGSPLNPIAVL